MFFNCVGSFFYDSIELKLKNLLPKDIPKLLNSVQIEPLEICCEIIYLRESETGRAHGFQSLVCQWVRFYHHISARISIHLDFSPNLLRD